MADFANLGLRACFFQSNQVDSHFCCPIISCQTAEIILADLRLFISYYNENNRHMKFKVFKLCLFSLLFLVFSFSCTTLYDREPSVSKEFFSGYRSDENSSKSLISFAFQGGSYREEVGKATIYNLETGETLITKNFDSNADGLNTWVSYSYLFLPPGVYAIVQYDVVNIDYKNNFSSYSVVLEVEDEAPWFVVQKENKTFFFGRVVFKSDNMVTIENGIETKNELDKLMKSQWPSVFYENGFFILEDEEKINLKEV